MCLTSGNRRMNHSPNASIHAPSHDDRKTPVPVMKVIEVTKPRPKSSTPKKCLYSGW